jgi:NhaP-type Na+/H+ or K+/H+ antiporter
MTVTAWIAAAGALLLASALTSGWIRRLPITSFWIFLAAGIALGPWGWDELRLDVPTHAPWLSLATELSLVVSLFVTGLKLRLPLRDPTWRVCVRLALPGMLLCIGGVMLAMHGLFALSWPLALVCGAMIAPTDPVLASIVSVDDAADHDGLRFALSGEAGLNDGAALPFLVLGLLWARFAGAPSSGELQRWLLHEVIWPLPAGLAIGGAIGWLSGLLGTRTRQITNETAPSDFLALAIILLVFAAAHWLSASVFLAAFAAGVGLRRAELQIVAKHPYSVAGEELRQDDRDVHPPAELLIERNRLGGKEVGPAESIGLVVSDALSFGDTLERLLAVILVFVAGVALAGYWSVTAIAATMLLFLVVRPLSVYLATMGSHLPTPRRWLMGWLGVRGVGTINYLAYALNHGLRGRDATMLANLAITTVVLSVILHGVTAQPLMAWRMRRMASKEHEATGD